MKYLKKKIEVCEEKKSKQSTVYNEAKIYLRLILNSYVVLYVNAVFIKAN